VIDDNGEQRGGHEEELNTERVVTLVVRRFELPVYEEERSAGRGDEKHLHERVVHRHKTRKQIEIARGVHGKKENLGFPRDS